MVFGSGLRASYELCLPAFKAMSRVQHHLGAFGNGSRMKFVANHLVNIHNVAAAEAMVLGMKAGLDPATVCQVISESAGSSRMFQVRGPMMAAGDYTAVSMALGLWRKDIETIAAFAADVQCPVPLFAAAAQPYYAALAQGLGDQDTAAVCAVLEAAARVVRASRKTQAPPRIVRRNRSMQEKLKSRMESACRSMRRISTLSWRRRGLTCCWRLQSTTFSIFWAATAISSSSGWMRLAKAVICRS